MKIYQLMSGKIHRLLFLLFLTAACQREEVVFPDTQPDPAVMGNNDIRVLTDEVGGIPIVVAGSTGRNFAVAFKQELAGQLLTFSPVQGRMPVIMEDQLGNQWNVFGRAVAGPDRGVSLQPVNAGMGYWFVFGAMYPGVEIHTLGRSGADPATDTLAGWLIPTGAVAHGTGFDGITALNDPDFTTYHILETDPDGDFFLEDDDLVIVISRNGETKAYPHAILDWHEVINDVVGGDPLTLTYCPLTGTAKAWERSGSDISASFGVSGLLYNSNLIPFDRQSESYWHQLEGKCIFGDRTGEQLDLIPHLETNWGTWKLMEQSPLVMSANTGINRDYTKFPYGDYKDSELISFPLDYTDRRLPLKERVFSVITEREVKVYRLSDI